VFFKIKDPFLNREKENFSLELGQFSKVPGKPVRKDKRKYDCSGT